MAIVSHVRANLLDAGGVRVSALRAKEKFAALRLHCDVARGDDGDLRERLTLLVGAAERASTRVCDNCGMPGQVRKSRRGWYSTRCGVCATPGTSPAIATACPNDSAGLSLGRGVPFVAPLCSLHGEWLRNGAPERQIRYRHRPIVVAAFALCRKLLSDHGGRLARRHVLRRLEMRDGLPVIEITVDRRRLEDGDGVLALVTAAVPRIAPESYEQDASTFGGAEADLDPDAPHDGVRAAEDAGVPGTESGTGRPARDTGEAPDPGLMPLYAIDDVAAALGEADGAHDEEVADTEHRRRLRTILRRGDAGRWRTLTPPSPAVVAALDDLGMRAPHMAEVTGLVRLHMLSGLNTGLPTALPATLLVGEPGVGKTWYLSRLAESLGVPFRTYPMNGSTLGEGLFGASPSWRNAQPGLIANTLLREGSANPVIFVDEFDKAGGNSANPDPYRPFYTALEPAGSRRLVDEYLGFPIDASHVNWFLSANATQGIPDPVLDRLLVLHVPPLNSDALVAVAHSIYADANARHRGFFAVAPEPEVVASLVTRSPRAMRIALGRAMVGAAAENRRSLRAADLPPDGVKRKGIGFHR